MNQIDIANLLVKVIRSLGGEAGIGISGSSSYPVWGFGRGEFEVWGFIQDNNFTNDVVVVTPTAARSSAARALRAIPSEKRTEQSKINGSLGGRPRRP